MRVRFFRVFRFLGNLQAEGRTDREDSLKTFLAQHKRRGLAIYRSERGNLGYVDWRRECFRPHAPYRFAEPPHPGRAFYQRYQWAPPHPRIDRCRPEEVSAAFRAFNPALDETRRAA